MIVISRRLLTALDSAATCNGAGRSKRRCDFATRPHVALSYICAAEQAPAAENAVRLTTAAAPSRYNKIYKSSASVSFTRSHGSASVL